MPYKLAWPPYAKINNAIDLALHFSVKNQPSGRDGKIWKIELVRNGRSRDHKGCMVDVDVFSSVLPFPFDPLLV